MNANAAARPASNREVGYFLSLLFQAFMLFVILLFMLFGNPRNIEPLVISRVGLVVTLICAIQLGAWGVLRPPFLLFATFVLFSFGVPLILAVNPSYTDWYLQQIDYATYSYFCCYTILCVQAYSIGLLLACQGESYGNADNKGSNRGFFDGLSQLFEENNKTVSSVSTGLIIDFGLDSFADACRFTATSVAAGIGAARQVVQNSALDNLCRGMFVPAGFMVLSYSRSSSRKHFVLGALFFYAALTCLSGDRTEGLTLLVAVFVYWYWRMGSKGGANFLKSVVAFFACIFIIFLIPAIASFRIGGNADFGGIGAVIEGVFSELGFNFYTVCFQSSLHLPTYNGLTYLASLTALLPTSFDFLGVREAANVLFGEVIYNKGMAAIYPWATFGLGYSLVAESFLNFKVFGFLLIALFGFLGGRLCGRDGRSSLDSYLSYSFLWAFLTLARRGFNFPVNSIEYILLFVPFLVYVLLRLSLHLTSKRHIRGISVGGFHEK